MPESSSSASCLDDDSHDTDNQDSHAYVLRRTDRYQAQYFWNWIKAVHPSAITTLTRKIDSLSEDGELEEA